MQKFVTSNKKLKIDQQVDDNPVLEEQELLNPQSSDSYNCYILDGQFFKVIKEENKNISTQCQLCSKIIIGQKGSTGNFLSHIKVSV